MKNSTLYILLFTIAFLSSCKKKEKEEAPAPQTPTGKIEVVFVPKKGTTPFIMNTDIVTPAGETIKISKWKFFLSNIGLSKADASENPAIPTDSNTAGIYHIDFGAPTTTVDGVTNAYSISFNATVGSYNDIRFDVGIPREKNHADPTSALFPLDLSQEDMYWSWNSGYVFMLIEGSGNTVANYDKNFHFGIGTDARMMSFFFGNMLNTIPKYTVEEGKTTKLIIEIDMDRILTNGDGTLYSFTSKSSAQVHGGYYADMVKANISEAMSLVSTKIIQ